MTDSRQAWDEVGQRLTALGRRLREHFATREDGSKSAAADREAVEQALRTLADALEGMASAVGDVVRDPAVREEARRAGDSLGTALGTAFAEFGDVLRERFQDRRANHGQEPPEG